MITFLVEVLGATIISIMFERIIRKALTCNNNVNDIHIEYQAQTEDELVIVADTQANKLFKFSNYI